MATNSPEYYVTFDLKCQHNLSDHLNGILLMKSYNQRNTIVSSWNLPELSYYNGISVLSYCFYCMRPKFALSHYDKFIFVLIFRLHCDMFGNRILNVVTFLRNIKDNNKIRKMKNLF